MDMYSKYLENTKRPLLSLKSLNNKDKIFTNGYSLMGRDNIKFVEKSTIYFLWSFFCKKSP